MSLLRATGLRRNFSIPADASEIEPNRAVESTQDGEDGDSNEQDRQGNMFGAIKRVDLSKDSDKQFLQWSSNLKF